jgi:hypothetical protein
MHASGGHSGRVQLFETGAQPDRREMDNLLRRLGRTRL